MFELEINDKHNYLFYLVLRYSQQWLDIVNDAKVTLIYKEIAL